MCDLYRSLQLVGPNLSAELCYQYYQYRCQ